MINKVIKSFGWIWLVLSILIIFESFLSMFVSVLFKNLVDFAINYDRDAVQNWMLASIVTILLNIVVAFLELNLELFLLKKITLKLKESLFQHFLNISVIEYNNEGSEKILSIFSNDLKILERDYIKPVFVIIKNITLFLFSFILLFIWNILFGFIVMTMLFLMVIIPRIFSKKLNELKIEYLTMSESFISKVKDFAEGKEVISLYNINEFIRKKFFDINNDVENQNYYISKFFGFYSLGNTFIGLVIVFLILIIGSKFLLDKVITVGLLIACIQLLNNILSPVTNIANSIAQMSSSKKTIQKLDSLLITDQMTENMSLENIETIRFENVSYEKNHLKILQSINMEICRGDKVALIGFSGSGKTSIINLLLKYAESYTGNIYINNVELRNLSENNWFEQISYIAQKPFLFKFSIRENIIFDKNEINEDLLEELGISALNINGEYNDRLSAGEKHRICIARALCKVHQILLVDELETSLDKATYTKILTALFKEKSKTIISATHNISKENLSMYDKIFIIKKGQIVAEGNYQLIKDSIFFKELSIP